MNANGGAWRILASMAVALIFGIGATDAAHAQDIPGYPRAAEALDLREVALLPRYCNYTQMFREKVPGGNDSAVINGWYAQLGPTFHHLHHYCLGLIKNNRAMILARDHGVRQFYLGAAIVEFDYVIDRASDDFILLPEIITKKGEALVQLGKGPVAVLEFQRAIELKNDYWPPYAYLSDYYKGTGELGKARELIESGLAHSPDSKALQRRLSELESATTRRSTKH